MSTGKVVFITGAGRGIGKGIAEVLAEAGADIALNALTPKYVEGAAADIAAASGRRVVPVIADVTKPDDVRRAVGSILDTFGRIDVLVNALGDSIRKPLVALPGDEAAAPGVSDDELRFIMDINLTEALLCTRAVGPHMLARRVRQGDQHCIVDRASGRPGHGHLHGGQDRACRIYPRAGARMGALQCARQCHCTRTFSRRRDVRRRTLSGKARSGQSRPCRSGARGGCGKSGIWRFIWRRARRTT